MKIIDFDKKGNVVRFYLGEDVCNDYWGDDWNDAPYEHNAGTVYNRYVKEGCGSRCYHLGAGHEGWNSSHREGSCVWQECSSE